MIRNSACFHHDLDGRGGGEVVRRLRPFPTISETWPLRRGHFRRVGVSVDFYSTPRDLATVLDPLLHLSGAIHD